MFKVLRKKSKNPLQFSTSEILLTCCDGNTSRYESSFNAVQESFTNQKWVKACYNRKGSHRMGVLTTAWGLILEDQPVQVPYDRHINEVIANDEYRRVFQETIVQAIRDLDLKLIVIFSGGCPLAKYVTLVDEAANTNGCGVLGFGRPNMCDVGQVEAVLKALREGTSTDKIRALLNCPETLVYRRAD